MYIYKCDRISSSISHDLSILTPFQVDHLPDGITALINLYQDFCTDAERQRVKDLTTWGTVRFGGSVFAVMGLTAL